MPNEVDVTDCDATKCLLERSKDYKLTVKFTAPQDAENLKLDIKARVLAVYLPWRNQPENICEKQISCPLKKGSEYTYKASFGDLSNYPRISGTVYYRLVDDKEKTQFCFTMKFSLK